MARCTARTARGTQCAINSLAGSNTCRIHSRNQRYFTEGTLADIRSNAQNRILNGLNVLKNITNETHLNDFLNSNIIGRIIEIMFQSDSIRIVDAAIWVLTNACAIQGNAGSNATWRHLPDMAERCRNFLFFKRPNLVSSLIMCLSNIAASNPEYALEMIDNDYHIVCIEHIKDVRLTTPIRKNASLLLLNLASQMNNHVAEDVLGELNEMSPILLTDASVISDILWIMSRLYNISAPTNMNYAFLIESLGSRNLRISSPALQTIGDIISGEDTLLINKFIKAGLVRVLHELLLRGVQTQMVLWVFSNLAVEQLGAMYIAEEPGLLCDINSKVHSGNDIYFILSNLATRGAKKVIDALLRCGSGLVLMMGLHSGAAFIRSICVEGLLHFLNKGGFTVYLALQTAGLRASLSSMNTELIDASFLTLLIESMDRFSTVGPPVAAATAPAADPVVPAIEPTNAGRMAVARLVTELSRGTGGAGAVDVRDLLFTADDVAYLIGLGYVFQAGGILGIPTRVLTLSN
jgi:hypothetical protein